MKYKKPELYEMFSSIYAEAVCVDGNEASSYGCTSGVDAISGCASGISACSKCLTGSAALGRCINGAGN